MSGGGHFGGRGMGSAPFASVHRGYGDRRFAFHDRHRFRRFVPDFSYGYGYDDDRYGGRDGSGIVRCESVKNRSNECRLDGRARLIRQLSGSPIVIAGAVERPRVRAMLRTST